MNNIINKIKNTTLEQFNKGLLFVALVSLLFRTGNFSAGYITKPFELLFLLLILLTFADFVINKKFKEFFLSINKKIWVAIACLVFSILLGWVVALFIKGIPSSINTILEFGTFMVSLIAFILILFYTRNDKLYIKKYFYALLLPVVYVIFVLFTEGANFFNLENNGTFLGLTLNPNVISKILLIPALFFIVHSLFRFKNKWIKIGHIAISCAMVALLFWVASRGGLVSLVFSFIFVWLVFSLHNFNWKKLLYSGTLLLLIFLTGFLITPQTGQQRVLLRALYPSGSDVSSYVAVQDKSANDVVSKFINDKSDNHIFLFPSRETRFQIWPFYLKYIIANPFGIGPNTHLSFSLRDSSGEYINSGPHNTFLQIWFWGGLLGILSFLYIFINAFKNLKTQLNLGFNPTAFALLCVLFAVSISIMFDDSLSFFWFFIILALALRYENTTS